MRIATEVKGYMTAPAPEDIVYAPIDLARQISDGLATRGHDVDFYGPEGTWLEHANVVTRGLRPLVTNYDEYHDALISPAFHSDNVLATWDQYLAAEMFRRAAAGEYDLLHFHHPEVALPYVQQYPDVPVAYTMHDPIEPLQREMLRMHETPSQHIISISNKQREAAPELTYAATVYNGVDTDLFMPAIQSHRDYLLFLGSILPHKGAKEAVEVARRTGENLLLVGPTYPDGMDYYEQHVQPYLNDKIRHIGHVAHRATAAYFQHAKTFLMPIQWEEPFGLTMAEAQACGTPVVALRRGSAPEVVEHEHTGFVVDTLDEMVEAIKRVDMIDPAACRQRALGHFSLQAMVRGYEQTFARILAAS